VHSSLRIPSLELKGVFPFLSLDEGLPLTPPVHTALDFRKLSGCVLSGFSLPLPCRRLYSFFYYKRFLKGEPSSAFPSRFCCAPRPQRSSSLPRFRKIRCVVFSFPPRQVGIFFARGLGGRLSFLWAVLRGQFSSIVVINQLRRLDLRAGARAGGLAPKGLARTCV